MFFNSSPIPISVDAKWLVICIKNMETFQQKGFANDLFFANNLILFFLEKGVRECFYSKSGCIKPFQEIFSVSGFF